MEFIKKMKTREYIEMGLKTFAAILVAFIAIILMEGMIYSIHLNALETKSGVSVAFSGSTVAYCIKRGDDKYSVIYYNEGSKDSEGNLHEWSSHSNSFYTKEQCDKLNVKEVVYRAPSAFELKTITPVHYVVMGVFMSAVAGFFVYKFIKLTSNYKEIEDNFNKTGTIEITNK